jgi:hypothetical protein
MESSSSASEANSGKRRGHALTQEKGIIKNRLMQRIGCDCFAFGKMGLLYKYETINES